MTSPRSADFADRFGRKSSKTRSPYEGASQPPRGIRDAIRRIERYAKRGRRVFEEDELIHTWMIHHSQIIGEAASQLTPKFRETHQHVPWPQIIKMRHVLVHDYLGIDLGEVWAVVERDLPTLKKQINTLLKHMPKRPSKG